MSDETTPAPTLLLAKRRHTARWVACLALAILVAVSVVAATRQSFQASQAGSPLLGKPAPQFSGTDFEGRRVSLDSYRGRYVYVNFFASWCPPCRAEEPNLLTFAFDQQKKGPSGAALVSVVFNEYVSTAQGFATKSGQFWPTVPDHNGMIASEFGVLSPPMTFLVDPQGIVIGVWEGPVKTSQLNSMLAEARGAGA